MGNCEACKQNSIPSMPVSSANNKKYQILKHLMDTQTANNTSTGLSPTTKPLLKIESYNYKGFYDDSTGEAEGKGYYINEHVQFEGEWHHGRPLEGKYNIQNVKIKIYKNGTGVINWPDGKMYHGQLENLVPQGYGRMTFTSGDYYEGQWSMGKYHGRGKYKWQQSGKRFIGVYQHGERMEDTLLTREVPEVSTQQQVREH